jgi:hypothetical protein
MCVVFSASTATPHPLFTSSWGVWHPSVDGRVSCSSLRRACLRVGDARPRLWVEMMMRLQQIRGYRGILVSSERERSHDLHPHPAGSLRVLSMCV